MKNNKLAVMATVLVIVAMLAAVYSVYADSDNLAVTFAGTNYDPTADNCVVSTNAYSPTESGTTAVTVRFNVSDTNGVADLNDTLAKADLDNATTFSALYESATNTSCTTSSIDADTRQYTCTVNMQYWYSPTTNYSARCSAGDKNDTTLVTANHNNAFAYAQLVASSADSTAVSFGTIASGNYNTNVSDANSPVNITNTGNVALATVSVTGVNATATGKPNIDVGQFLVDDDSGVAGAQALTAVLQQITGVSVPVEDSTAGGNTDSLWTWFNVPATLEPGDYTSTWTLTEAA
jgi:hypothetical protein